MSRAPAPVELPVPLGGIVDGKFRVERVLGAGGMGVVVEATHLLLRQRVALKFIRREIARDNTNVTRFLREARACVQLRSSHIARIMDVGTLPPDDTPFLVMEYLEGRTADELLRDGGPLPSATAVSYLLQACVGMAEAHALGIVHRDLKPHNLFVTTTPAGRPLVKILDFGISKAALAGAEDMGLTDSRTVVGSPAYMAPEQMESSKDVDLRADIWSLGAVLFALVSGGPPFRGQTLLQLCARVETGEREPLDAERLEVPASVVAVIDACLRRKAADRPQDLGALAALLAPCTPGGDELAAEVAATLKTTRPPAATPVPASRPSSGLATTVPSTDDSLVGATSTPSPGEGASQRRRGWIAAVIAAGIVAIAGAWFLTRERSKSNATSRTIAAPDARDRDAIEAIDASTVDAVTPDGTASPVDAAIPVDAAAPHVRHVPPRPPPPPPPPPLPPDAGTSDTRHPRDRRN